MAVRDGAHLGPLPCSLWCYRSSNGCSQLLISGCSSGVRGPASFCVNRTTSWVSNIRWQVLGEASAFVLAPLSQQLFPVSLCDEAANQPWPTHWPADWNAVSAWCKVTSFSEVASIWCTCRLIEIWTRVGALMEVNLLCCFLPLCEQCISTNPFITHHYRRYAILSVMCMVIWLHALLRWKGDVVFWYCLFKEEVQEDKQFFYVCSYV